MLPSLFSTEAEITKKLKDIARIHTFDNAQIISHIFYDVFKTSHFALKRKITGIGRASSFPIVLKRKEITRIVKLIDYHHLNDKRFTVTHELGQCFGKNFTEDDALKFFEKSVEGNTKDKYGREIRIDLDDGIKFMYKDLITGRHEINSANYKPERGKRLPWIKHTLHNTSNIYTRIDGHEREIMYISKYDLPYEDIEQTKGYWVVIVKKNKKDRRSPYNFRTAFPIFKYNHLLARLERYCPIIYAHHLVKK
jgi:hypothetical protein